VAISKSDARRLAKDGVEMGAHVLRGILTIGPDGAKIDKRNILEWLAQHADMELILIAAPINRVTAESQTKTCFTCGRDYQGDACPYCTEARARLRG
jgi:hypothetical protein